MIGVASRPPVRMVRPVLRATMFGWNSAWARSSAALAGLIRAALDGSGQPVAGLHELRRVRRQPLRSVRVSRRLATRCSQRKHQSEKSHTYPSHPASQR